ncbi:MAG: Mur ligase family protein [Cyclobacteriaceae bacterium]
MDFSSLYTYLFLATYLFYGHARVSYEMHMLQHSSYMPSRYLRWFKTSHSIANRLKEVAFIAMVLVGDLLSLVWLFWVGVAGLLVVSVLRLVKRKKKALVYTNRASRLYASAALIVLIISYALVVFTELQSLAFVVIYLSPVAAVLAVFVMAPMDNWITNKYINEAKAMLKSRNDLIIIGITGSYGKTSTKNFLKQILRVKYSVLMTPGSFNTTLGVVRTIREQLKAHHQVFIVEMGAKKPHDIKEICDLVNPKIGILTAVGAQHLETFKSIENIRQTKFELIDSLPQDGMGVLNADYEIIRNTEVSNTPVVYYSIEGEKSGYHADKITFDRSGTRFDLIKNGQKLDTVQTKILGSFNISNILACIAVGEKLGLGLDQMKFGIQNLTGAEHRLQLRKAGKITILDDAYNSNIKGAEMALKVLGMFEQNRIIITPGIIELGDLSEEINKKLGNYISEYTDIAIIVGDNPGKYILDGIKETGKMTEGTYHGVKNLTEARSLLREVCKDNDTVLYENDLPDLLEQ